MYAVGVDSGTQGTKVLIVDFDGKIVGRGYAPHSFPLHLKPGESEQEAGMWITALSKALHEALQRCDIDPAQILSLGVSGQQHGFVPLDRDGSPIRPAKLWNDTSTIKETGEIIQKIGGQKKFIEKTGINLAVGFTASKILWLKRNEPENFAKLATILLPHNYINHYLTGIALMEYGDASGTGLMNIKERKWSAEVIAAIAPEIENMLPPLTHPREPVGYMKKEVAAAFNMSKVLVSGGGGDNMMAAIGTGNVTPGTVTLSLGTSGTVYAYFPETFVDPEGEIASFCDSTGGWLPLLCTMNVTNVSETVKEMFHFSNEELENCACEAPPGCAGLICLPFISGERVPALPDSTGVFFGLTGNNFKKSYISRSVLEGTVLNLGYGFNRMKSLNLAPEKIRATGGGSNSKLWLQIIADIFDTPVVTLKEQEAAAFGAALQSIWTYRNVVNGSRVDISEITTAMVRLDEDVIEPDKKNIPLYRGLQERFNSLWRTLKTEFSDHRTFLF
ncbi:xylulokinase [Acidobacteriota bacterium]